VTTIILGNADNLSVSDDNSAGDTISLGEGAGDTVSVVSSTNDSSGDRDAVDAGGDSDDTISWAMALVTSPTPQATVEVRPSSAMATTTRSISSKAATIRSSSATAIMMR
jgi:hypothetical protein